ncbi:spore cortex biosynthesis protein YabQ [Hathewaya proteolytica DSM 3090]|uniref:Spore cortex biosynthesis protein YabQ n=1 Tax=Hathewaya proteolytica DSM 3090 TaxID=1121331 RepID=A0A1M6M9G8_9CLOT|nr:spore cortex biosynthesis protein YabQ [Hathewaya proteolytica DSM 3090]
MILNLKFQLTLFVFSLLSGIMIGIFFDIYRMIRGINSPNNIITFIEDLLFWLLMSTIVFIFLLYTNYAYVSIYVYVLIFFGMYLYLMLFSRYILKTLIILKNILLKVLRITFKNLFFVFELIFSGFKKIFINK